MSNPAERIDALEKRVGDLELALQTTRTGLNDQAEISAGLRRQLVHAKSRVTLLERLSARLGGEATIGAALARHHITGAPPDNDLE